MSNIYLQNTKFARANSNQFGAESQIQEATDDWTTYFWNTDRNVISYVNPDTGAKVNITEHESAYDHMMTSSKIEWENSTSGAMTKNLAKAVNQAPARSFTPMPSSDEFSDQPEGENKIVEHLKENWIWYASGVGVSAIAVLAAKMMPSRDSGSPNYDNTILPKKRAIMSNRYLQNTKFAKAKRYGS